MAKFKNGKNLPEGFNVNVDLQAVVLLPQIGDKMYVPTEELFIVKTSVVTRVNNTTKLQEQVDVAPRIFVVDLSDDNQPIGVREMFIGQLVKVDISGRLVFPESPMSKALRVSGDKFKDVVCGQCLQVSDKTATFKDRTWDVGTDSYKRDEDGKLIPTEKTVNEIVVVPSTDVNTEACEKYLKTYLIDGGIVEL